MAMVMGLRSGDKERLFLRATTRLLFPLFVRFSRFRLLLLLLVSAERRERPD